MTLTLIRRLPDDLEGVEAYLASDDSARVALGVKVTDDEPDTWVPVFVLRRPESLYPVVKLVDATFNCAIVVEALEPGETMEVLDCWMARRLEAETGETQRFKPE